MIYSELNADDLRGCTIADYLISIEASFQVVDRSAVIYAEDCFPVAELARELGRWIASGEGAAGDFSFESLSFEDPGAVQISRAEPGWQVGSIFEPTTTSAPQSWAELEDRVGDFISNVRRDVLGLGIDPHFIGPG
ncbi:hypothetical protein [Mangrovactinospora gilvigrisea]|uniref:DUF7878 domain-containing protein n=1 Tax=Mangrovactinospora gilvigrisea TaxID=1428644 RepID=UPI001114FA92|nr:hypothetical protein [Mangrovactinospora gilvigrisea]